MRKYIIPLALVAVAFASCNKEEIAIPDDQKTAIEFSLSDGAGAPVTKAGFTEADTRIVARIQSDEKNGSGVRYVKTVLTASKDAATTPSASTYSVVGYATNGETRYWDDAFGRNGQLSVYAVAIPNSTATTKLAESLISGGATWAAETSPNNSIVWSVSTDQSGNPLAAEDLAYSNNISENGKDGRYTWDYANNGYPTLTGETTHADGRLVFTQASGAQASDAGHFDKGHLVFTHALSRMTVTLTEGDGFDGAATTAADFNFTTSGANIQLNGMNTAGTLNIATGSWAVTTVANIVKMAPTGTHYGANGAYASQMLPGYKFYKDDGTESVKNVMQFVIDNNTYYVTQAQVFAALNVAANTTGTNPAVIVKQDTNSKEYIEMEQGKNYNLTVTVKKTGILAITATIAAWVDVTGSTSINNAHLEFTMTASGTACDKDIDLYRLGDDNTNYSADNYDFTYEGKNWFGNYTTGTSNKTTLLQTALQGGKWSTGWYFESNKTYYHFRTVNKDTVVKDNDNSNNDYFEITGGAVASTDPHWGAPMTGAGTTGYLKYDTAKGYEDFLRPAIGATESTVAIQEVHMMSNINVILKTPTDGGKVTLDDGTNKTIVKITRLATSGKVEMGRGLVTPGTTYTGEHTMTVPTTYWASSHETSKDETQAYTFAVVPQALSRDETSTNDADYVGIFIQTPDHNQYYVVKKLITVTASAVTDERNQTKDAAIKRWYPGHNYTYTITISKKGIDAITATVADWVNVSGNVGNITLED